MAVPTRARRSPSSTPTVAPLSLFYFSHRLNAISLSPILNNGAQPPWPTSLSTSSFPLFSTSSSLSLLIFSKENFHGQNPYFGFRILCGVGRGFVDFLCGGCCGFCVINLVVNYWLLSFTLWVHS
jgi:hypothetical protein